MTGALAKHKINLHRDITGGPKHRALAWENVLDYLNGVKNIRRPYQREAGGSELVSGVCWSGLLSYHSGG